MIYYKLLSANNGLYLFEYWASRLDNKEEKGLLEIDFTNTKLNVKKQCTSKELYNSEWQLYWALKRRLDSGSL